MGFDLTQVLNDAGTQLQNDATSWLRSEISGRLAPVSVQPQPVATTTVAQVDQTKQPAPVDTKKIMLYVGMAIVGIIVLALAFKGGKKRGK